MFFIKVLYECVLLIKVINKLLFIKFSLGRLEGEVRGIKFLELLIVVELVVKFVFLMIRF